MNPVPGASSSRVPSGMAPAARNADGPCAAKGPGPSAAARPVDPADMERVLSRIPMVDQPAPPIDLSGLPGMDRLMKIDAERVARSGAFTAAAAGTAFALTFPACNVLRASASHPAIKVAAGLLPALGGAMTAFTEPGIGEAMDHRPTTPREPGLWHDAINPGMLFGAIAAYQRSPLPKFPATSLPGAAISAGLSIAGAFAGGAAAEAAAQLTRQGASPVEEPEQPGTAAKALGRGASLVPFAAYMGMAVLRPGAAITPPRPSLMPAAVATGGWAFRNVLTPAPAGATPTPPPPPLPPFERLVFP